MNPLNNDRMNQIEKLKKKAKARTTEPFSAWLIEIKEAQLVLELIEAGQKIAMGLNEQNGLILGQGTSEIRTLLNKQ